MITVKIEQIISALKNKNYSVFEDDTKPYNLNIVGIRSNNNIPNSFDDILTVFWKYQSKWTLRIFSCTTDPGSYWLMNPENSAGTAIVKPGQYSGLWHIGLHQGKYKALVQKNPVTVMRDGNKDNKLDFDSLKEETGIFGINCHRANENGQSISVDKWSAGCTVLQNKEIFNPENQAVKCFEFDYFMNLCEKSKSNWQDSFTYTLMNEKDVLK